MIDIPAYRKIATRIRPTAQVCVRPTPETMTTHAADFPHCGRETRVGTGEIAAIYGGCSHFVGVQESGAGVFVTFDGVDNHRTMPGGLSIMFHGLGDGK